MSIPCEKCKRKISFNVGQCPHCKYLITDDWVKACAILSSTPKQSSVGRISFRLFLCVFVVVAIVSAIDGFNPVSQGTTATNSAPAPVRDANAVPFSRIWRDISSTFGLSPALAQSMAKKVRAEGYHCDNIHSYQKSEEGKYNLLCDGLAYVYVLTEKDGLWVTVTPDKKNPDQKDARSALEKAEESGDIVRKTPNGREYRITEFALSALENKRILKSVDMMVGFVHDEGKKCDRVIVALILSNSNAMSISCGEEHKPSKDYDFNWVGDTLVFNQITSD